MSTETSISGHVVHGLNKKQIVQCVFIPYKTSSFLVLKYILKYPSLINDSDERASNWAIYSDKMYAKMSKDYSKITAII